MDASTNCTVQTNEGEFSRLSAFSSGLALSFQVFVTALLKDDKLTVNQICGQIEARLTEIEESKTEMQRIISNKSQRELRFHATEESNG